MTEAWLNYGAILFFQFLLILVHAYYEKKLPDMSRILWMAALTGLVAGPIFDLTGKNLGLVSYALGFGAFFLTFNGIVGYGIFIANILLMQRARLLHFCTWIVAITAGFEIPNLLTHSWTYTFSVPSMEYWAVAFVAPLGFAITIALVWHKVFGYRFVLIDRLFK